MNFWEHQDPITGFMPSFQLTVQRPTDKTQLQLFPTNAHHMTAMLFKSIAMVARRILQHSQLHHQGEFWHVSVSAESLWCFPRAMLPTTARLGT